MIRYDAVILLRVNFKPFKVLFAADRNYVIGYEWVFSTKSYSQHLTIDIVIGYDDVHVGLSRRSRSQCRVLPG